MNGSRPWLVRLEPWVPLLAVVVCLPALFGGLELDDVLLAARSTDTSAFISSAFTFFGEGQRTAHVAITDLPWWTDPAMRLDLMRPLAAVSHLIDFRLWPNQPWLMHLHSLLWYAALVLGVQRLVTEIGGDRRRATLAALVFGFSQAHAMNVGWLSARNAIIAATLVTLALWLHHRWRTRRSIVAAVAAPCVFGLALLANEGAVAAFGYLVAYAWIMDEGRRPFASLLPIAAVIVIWRVAYGELGYGAVHSGIYLDPSADPLGYGLRTVVNASSMFAARFGIAVLDGLGAVPGATLAAAAVSIPFLLGLAWLAREPLRSDRSTRMWALGMLACGITAGTSVPTDRGLVLIGLGGSALIAELIVRWRVDASRLRRALAWSLIGLHLILAPLLMLVRVQSSAWVHGFAERITQSLPHEAAIEDATVVLLQAPSDLALFYSRAIAEAKGQPFPRHFRWLYAGPAAVELRRIDEHAVELRPERPWLESPLDRMFRRDVDFEVGQRVDLPCMSAEVLEVASGSAEKLPTALRFDFHDERPDCRVVVLRWDAGEYRPFELPPVGGKVVLAPATLP